MSKKANGKRGAVSKEEQIQRLKARMSPADVAAAQELAGDPRRSDIVRLAFKLLEPSQSPSRVSLTKGQQATYEELKAISPKMAETWKKKKLEERLAAPRRQPKRAAQA